MDVETILALLVGKLGVGGTVALTVLGTLVVVGVAIVAITPSTEDDKFLDWAEKHPIVGGVLRFLISFSPLQKKPKPPVS